MLRQTPDSNGCITINWPSNNVPHGGVFHSRKADPSSDAAGFLKVLLEESKLASELRKKSSWALRDNLEEPRGTAEVGGGERALRTAPPSRPRTSRRRSLSCIRQSAAFDTDEWRPRERGEDRDEMKQRLQELMEWGESAQKQRQAPPAPLPVKKGPKLPSVEDVRQDLLSQIRERAEWLEEMEALGHAAPHRELIRDQIAERMRRLTTLRLDTERSQRSSVKGSARAGSMRGDASAGAGRQAAEGSARSSVRSERSVGKEKRVTDSRSRSAAPGQRQADENVTAYISLFSPLGRSPRRRS